MKQRSIRLAFDIGGTFTDIVLDVDGKPVSAKVLTTPEAPERGALEGINVVLAEAGVKAADLTLLVHGTTLATNAIIERKGAATALVTTAGFRDSLEMAYENRFEQYDMYIQKPAPLVPRRLRLTVPERMNAAGQPLLPLDEAAVRDLAPRLREAGVAAAALGFLHSYANDVHERRAAEILREELPDLFITLSSEVCPEVREYERLSTAVANAYVQPLMASYLVRLERELTTLGVACPMFLMTSGGGLTTFDAAARFPIRLVESGPAGGAILASAIAAELGITNILSFDMGGTTAKICLIDDATPQKSRFFEVDRRYRFIRGSGLPVRIPVIEMVEIGAGGGSIAAVDAARRITVGPDSAGASPGPACYKRGGSRPAVTDADLLLGRISSENFAGGRLELDILAAEAAIYENVGAPLGLPAVTAAFGIAEIVEENMASAARVHTVERGKSLDGRVMIAFGGAAPLHAARVAEKVGIDEVIIPAAAGVGSAVGFLRAPIAFERVRSLYTTLSTFDTDAVNAAVASLLNEATAEVRRGAGDDAALSATLSADMRYRGQGHEVVVTLPLDTFTSEDAQTLRDTFEMNYAALYGRRIPGLDVEILTWTVSVSTQPHRPLAPTVEAIPFEATPTGVRVLHDPAEDSIIKVPAYDRTTLQGGAFFEGPAVVTEAQTTTFVPRTFTVSVDAAGNLRLRRNTA